ncbi:alpha-hydroxy-acid oxidizing protein [Kribbella sp. NPDC004536]|uniref:alpha-hydroxy acid oxidase n=1 Tax=Kribbella sp. NPDC004536 TaxID=3364106 RepID=UPI0036B8A5B7
MTASYQGIPTPAEFARLAERRLSAQAAAYIGSAAGSGRTAAWNEQRWAEIQLAPRVGIDVRSIDPEVELFGRRRPHPILLGPTGSHRLVHPDGEVASVRGAGAAGATYVASSYTTTPLAEIAAAATGPWWHQLNPAPDHGYVTAVLDEATSLGAEALVITMDTPVAGMRSGQGWDGVTLPDGLEFGVLKNLPGGLEPVTDPEQIYRPALDAGWTWDQLARVCSGRSLPILVKGILRPDDAEHAIAAGAAGIIVSNHGGRNLDSLPPTADALPRVADRVAGRVPVLVDGGIRSGDDALKALALGADAVLIGRPYLWGLAVDGAEGVRQVVTRLRVELEMAMALCGLRTTEEIGNDALW